MAGVKLAIDRLIEGIEQTGNPTAVGLDTRVEYLPQAMQEMFLEGGEWTAQRAAQAILYYNRTLIDALNDIVPCAKVQVAYYEMLGEPGMQAFSDTLAYAAQKGMVVIADVKRNDIGATAEAYAQAYLASNAPFQSDFVTVNPYLGIDGVKPFMDTAGQQGGGLFALVKTSNPSGGDFQDLVCGDGRQLFEHVAERVSKWGADSIGMHGYSAVGAVVGATYPAQGTALRKMLPHTFFLVPGYGAQGATAQDLSGCFDAQGRGSVVNASRSILTAHRKQGTHDAAAAARAEAIHMRDAIAMALGRRSSV